MQISEQIMTMPDESGSGPPRKMTAIGTVGEVGQLFTVYEKNWKCPECNQENYATRPRCFRCRAHKPEGLENYVTDPALQAYQEGKEIEWQEVIDPSSYQVYYYNKVTGLTQWERPAEMGPAPHATGFSVSNSFNYLWINAFKFYQVGLVEEKQDLSPLKCMQKGIQST